MSAEAQHRAPERPGRRRMDFVDGIRGVSATYVVFHHLWQFAIADPRRPPPSWFRIVNVFEFGALGVAVFVVVSGYCLMLPVVSSGDLRLPGGLSGFATRRTLRIIPPYYAALVLSLIVLGLFRELRVPSGTPQDITLPTFTWSKSLSHLLLIHNWSKAWRWGFNPPHWTVALEFQIYFVFALVLLPVWRRLGPWLAVGLAFAISSVLFAVGLGFAAPWMLGLFALGMVAAWISVGSHVADRLRSAPWRTCSVVAWLLVPPSVLVGTSVMSGDSELLLGEMVVGLATMFGLVALSQYQSSVGPRRSVAGAFFAWRPVCWLGEVSYSTYLVHYPIVAAIAIAWVRPLELSVPATFVTLTAVCWPVILVVSVTFHRFIERPLLRRRALPA